MFLEGRGVQDGPMMRPRRPQMGPSCAQDGPRWAKRGEDGAKMAEDGEDGLQDAPLERQDAILEASWRSLGSKPQVEGVNPCVHGAAWRNARPLLKTSSSKSAESEGGSARTAPLLEAGGGGFNRFAHSAGLR